MKQCLREGVNKAALCKGMGDYMENITGYFVTCSECNQKKIIPITVGQYGRLDKGLKEGKCIQNVVPDLEEEWRELFITGICSDCWKKIFN